MMLSLPQHGQPFDSQQLSSNRDISEKLKEFRSKSVNRINGSITPTRKTEHWKYNDLSHLLGFDFAVGNSTEISDVNLNQIKGIKSQYQIAIVDGICQSKLDQFSNSLPSEVNVTEYSDASKEQLNLIKSKLEESSQGKNIFIELNHALTQNGILIEIEDNVEFDEPIYITHICSQLKSNKLDSSQVIIKLGQNSRVKIIEQFYSAEPAEVSAKNLTLQQTILVQQPSSHCDYYRLNLESSCHSQISRILIQLKTNASFNSFYYCEGSSLNKTDIDIQHIGEHSASNLIGIYLPSEDNTVDYHTNIQMKVPNCTSDEVFRGIIADQSKATFNGKIHIFKDAQKSDAKLSNKNLLLTNQAEVNTKPELEIYANDVVCAHGATIAKIDEQAIYYLQTRGINEIRARKMLSIGFINELLEGIDNQELKQLLSTRINDHLSSLN